MGLVQQINDDSVRGRQTYIAAQFADRNPVPERLADLGVDRRHVMVAVRKLLAENQVLRPGLVFEQARKIATAETSSAASAWALTIDEARKIGIGDVPIKMYLERCVPSEEGDVLVATSPSSAYYLTKRYQALLEEILRRLTDFNQLRFVDEVDET